MKMDGSVSIK